MPDDRAHGPRRSTSPPLVSAVFAMNVFVVGEGGPSDRVGGERGGAPRDSTIFVSVLAHMALCVVSKVASST